MRLILQVVLAFLLPLTVEAQSFYTVSHLNGSKPVGVNSVTVIPINSPSTTSACGTGPYWIGNGNQQTAYMYKFALPVAIIRVQLTNLGEDEWVGFEINGSFYPVTSADVTSYSGICPLPAGVASGGYVTSTVYNTGAQVTIDPPELIDSVKVFFHNGAKSGTHYSLTFASEPHIYIPQPFSDSMLCAGDSVYINYVLSDHFAIGNTFTVELSDASGSFANPTAIGSLGHYLASVIPCRIPASLPAGTGYRYRIYSTNPIDTSDDNAHDIRITHYPTVHASNNGPLCNGEMLHLTSSADNPDADLYWTGPIGFKSGEKDTSFVADLNIGGPYRVYASAWGCKSEAVTDVTVRPVPVIDTVYNNTPICEDEILKLSTSSDKKDAVFKWTGPNGFQSTLQNPAINNTKLNADGIYTIVADLDGCLSVPDTTVVVIRKNPVVPALTANTPLRPADSLQLTATSDDDVNYNWKGPGGFTSDLQNPVIQEVDNSAEGTYEVVVSNGSCSAAASISVEVYEKDVDVVLSPNPAIDNITVKGNALVNDIIPYYIISNDGKVIQKGEVATGRKFLNVSFSLPGNLRDGVYIIKLQLKDEERNFRFTIDR